MSHYLFPLPTADSKRCLPRQLYIIVVIFLLPTSCIETLELPSQSSCSVNSTHCKAYSFASYLDYRHLQSSPKHKALLFCLHTIPAPRGPHYHRARSVALKPSDGRQNIPAKSISSSAPNHTMIQLPPFQNQQMHSGNDHLKPFQGKKGDRIFRYNCPAISGVYTHPALVCKLNNSLSVPVCVVLAIK